MKILDRYLAYRIVSTLAKVAVSLVFLFILIDLFTYRKDDILGRDVPWDAVIRYYVVYIPTILYRYQGAALSMLVSALLVFGSAAQNNEITASLAAGIGLRRLVRIPLLVAAGLAVAIFLFQETVGVAACREADRLDKRYFSQGMESKRSGISWAHLGGRWTCHIMKFNRIALTGENLFMHSIRENSVEQVQARRVFWDPDLRQWIMEDGRWFIFDTNNNWECQVMRITQMQAPIEETPDELFALEQSPDMKTVSQLIGDIRRAERHGMRTDAHWSDLHAKFSQPALSFVMVLLAVPFAIRLRRGGLAIGFGVSIGIALVYLMLFRVSMGMGHIQHLPPVVAAWLANIVFLLVGIVLFKKTPT